VQAAHRIPSRDRAVDTLAAGPAGIAPGSARFVGLEAVILGQAILGQTILGQVNLRQRSVRIGFRRPGGHR
jgi:hypothetical protein